MGQFGAIEVPEALTAVAGKGVETLPELQDSFPAAARDALETALKEQAAGGVGDKFAAFLRSQLGVRSLTPKEGDDADAVLSRAEAALREGDLRAALSELDGLDDGARAEMAGWIDAARARADAVEAAQSLEQTLNSN
nr:mitofilin family membrane protein [Rhodovulum sulfidophilum]